MEQQLITKILQDLGRDGICNDMEIMYIFKALNGFIIGGYLIIMF
jgi:hypothetical protein